MQYNYKPIKSNAPRKIYLDLNHRLIIPWEFNPDAGGVDQIQCKVAGRMAWRLDNEYEGGGTAYCSECMELFDPQEVNPSIHVPGDDQGHVKVVTFVR